MCGTALSDWIDPISGKLAYLVTRVCYFLEAIMIGWNPPEVTPQWRIRRKRKVWPAIIFHAIIIWWVIVVVRIYAGPVEEPPKFEAAWSIDVRTPAGLYRVDGGWVGRNL